MAFDGFVTFGIVAELSSLLQGGKIDKIHQPEKDELVISVRTKMGQYKILLSAATSNPRLHLTEINRENPLTAPLFCMILRKHLAGGTIKAIHQQGFDRIVRFDIECYTEMGDKTEKSIICEIMGRHSNIILVQSDGKIIDSIKRVDFTTSAVRQVLPGLIYELPPKQDRLVPDSFEKDALVCHLEQLAPDTPLDKFLVGEFIGMSPLLAREITFSALGTTKAIGGDISSTELAENVSTFIGGYLANPTGGYVVFDNDTKKPVSFSCVKLNQYSGLGRIEFYDSLSQAVETFYAVRDSHDRMAQKAAGTLKLITNNIERCEKKIVLHTENIKKAQNREKYKIYGDLITANLYRIEENTSKVVLENFYSPENEPIEIQLLPELTPPKNAQRYYKLYSKAKATEEHSSTQLEEALAEKEYLESVLDAVSRATDPHDISDIRDELAEQGYITRQNSKKKQQKKKSTPHEFTSSDGYTILVGRNNKQNDELTIRTAFSTDMWLHTKKIPGSHVIIRTNGTGEVPDNTLVEAAKIAAYYSKAQKSKGVGVDYTLVKNIRKPNGSKPGFVIYDTNYTVFVDPDEELVEKLKKS